VLGCDVVDSVPDDTVLPTPAAAEQADLAAFQIRLEQIDNFDSGLEHFEARVLLDK